MTNVRFTPPLSKGKYESSLDGGSIYCGVRVLKTGLYASRRDWEVPYRMNYRIHIGTTRKNDGNKFVGVSFSGKEYGPSTRDMVVKEMVGEFLERIFQEKPEEV